MKTYYRIFHCTKHLYSYLCVCVHALCCSLCVILCDPMDYSLPGSSVHGIFQARILEWVAISFSNLFFKNTINIHILIQGKLLCDLSSYVISVCGTCTTLSCRVQQRGYMFSWIM